MTIVSNIDFHCHTQASDGDFTPHDVVMRAYGRGLNYLAITDHDLLDGVAEAVATAKEQNELLLKHDAAAPVENYIRQTAKVQKVENGELERTPEERVLTIIPGVEFSATWREEQIHIVGLFLDPSNPVLQNLVDKHRISRHERAVAISEKLERVGLHDAYAKCCAKAQEGASITRGNYARLIVEEGMAKSNEDAFRMYLGRGQKAYVKTEWSPIEASVEAITAAGGVAVLAHPRSYNFGNGRLRKLVTDFKNAGGRGLEVSSSQQGAHDRDYLAELCKRFDMFASLGSDFHHEGLYRELGQNLDLPEGIVPVWHTEEARRFGLSSETKQRLVHLTYARD